MKYDYLAIEKKWQEKWEAAGVFRALDEKEAGGKPKFYALVEFPYPSGAGMHVGHIKAYSGLEVVSRMRRMQGYNVLFPMGFDAFGLPTENYAIKTGMHPRAVTDKNIAKFTQQLKRVGYGFDWGRVIDTTDEDYYRWTQWIFLKMFEAGLAFRDTALVNYCPTCKVVLSNEDSQGGKCDICHSDVVQKSKDVWYLRITKYADRLLEGLKEVDYLPNIKQQQINWIGRSEGAFVNFGIAGKPDEKLRIYTTRPDTLFGVTFMVMAPEHPMIDKYASEIANMDEVKAYRAECAKKTEFERTQLVKDKTGVRLSGLSAVNPLTGKEIPIYIADYVMMGYGTGAIMAVPAHDQRDWEFAHKFGIDVIEVIKGGDVEKEAYAGDGEMINSGFLNGYNNKKDSIRRAVEELEKLGAGEGGVQYKMKDWAFNRQRYWGEPIPIVHCPKCGMVPVPYDELPLKLPDMKEFAPGQNGESPLARIPEFVHCKCPKCGGDARRETDTMPQWAGSSWYFLRYVDPHNPKCLADYDKLKYWMPVDWYNGGMEHVTRHMIYSRFWHKFLYDIGVVPCDEPYAKRTAQGLILGPDGEKMSKSKGNVVDPNTVVDAYGADVLRTYVLFMGDYTAAAPWSENGVRGCKRFLERVADLPGMVKGTGATTELEASVHKAVKKVTDDYNSLKFNTAIATLMGLLNEIFAVGSLTKDELMTYIKLLSPVAPHLCEEINEKLGGKTMLAVSEWPEYDESKTIDATVELAVQINGKVRSTVKLPLDCPRDEALAAAKADERIAAAIAGKTIVKEITVPNKIINIVVR
ncbi:leucine--tRNA ligase [Anaerotruncus sp. CAG:390]|nr:leucine--tRNA ligase [Anaerotruncus sp. CAG:390]